MKSFFNRKTCRRFPPGSNERPTATSAPRSAAARGRAAPTAAKTSGRAAAARTNSTAATPIRPRACSPSRGPRLKRKKRGTKRKNSRQASYGMIGNFASYVQCRIRYSQLHRIVLVLRLRRSLQEYDTCGSKIVRKIIQLLHAS